MVLLTRLDVFSKKQTAFYITLMLKGHYARKALDNPVWYIGVWFHIQKSLERNLQDAKKT